MASEHPGSWWNDWKLWLENTRKQAKPKVRLGSKDFPPIEPAPGRYVLEKIKILNLENNNDSVD